MAYLRLFITRSSPLKIEIATTRARAVPSGRAIKTQTYTIIVTHRHRVVRRSLALLHAYLSLALVDRSLQVIHVRRQTSDRTHGTLMIVLRRHRAARRCRRRRLSRDHKTGAHTAHRIARPNAPRTRNTNWRVIARRSSYRREKGEKNLHPRSRATHECSCATGRRRYGALLLTSLPPPSRDAHLPTARPRPISDVRWTSLSLSRFLPLSFSAPQRMASSLEARSTWHSQHSWDYFVRVVHWKLNEDRPCSRVLQTIGRTRSKLDFGLGTGYERPWKFRPHLFLFIWK